MPVALYGGKYSSPSDVSSKAESFYFMSPVQSSFAPHIVSYSDTHNVRLIDRWSNNYHHFLIQIAVTLWKCCIIVSFFFFASTPFSHPLSLRVTFQNFVSLKRWIISTLLHLKWEGEKRHIDNILSDALLSVILNKMLPCTKPVCARMWQLCQCSHEKDSDKEP